MFFFKIMYFIDEEMYKEMIVLSRWQCSKCGQVLEQSFPPSCCPNCGGFDFSRIGFGSSGGGNSSGGGIFNSLFMGICWLIGTVLGIAIYYIQVALKKIFYFIKSKIFDSNKDK